MPALVLGIGPVATWLAFNRLTFGAATPISGMLKLASAAGHRQFPVLNGMVVLLIAMTIVLTSLAAMRWREPRQQFAVSIGLGHLLFVAYLFAAGHCEAYAWYFVPLSASLAVTTPAALAGAARLVGRFLPVAGLRPSVVLAGMFGVIIVSSALFLRTSTRTGIQREWIVGDQALGRVARANGIDTVLAFDMPGQLAFLHGLNVIAADGLTTNYRFQKVLRQRGIGWLMATYHVQAIVGPRLENPSWTALTCSTFYLNAIRFTCVTDPTGRHLDTIRFFSRLDGHALGDVRVRQWQRLPIAPYQPIAVYRVPR